jgi:branched-subunit amino acid aminotransferase/4-amino-4-deoxychorismate lyase
VTRAILLEEIRVPGLTISERELTPSDLEQADQVFITSTTRDLLPVLEIEHETLAQAPGIFAGLREAFSAYQRNYTARRHADKIVAA